MDGSRLGPAHDVQSHRLVRVATKTPNLKIEVLDAGLSRYEPDPIAALERAERKRAV